VMPSNDVYDFIHKLEPTFLYNLWPERRLLRGTKLGINATTIY